MNMSRSLTQAVASSVAWLFHALMSLSIVESFRAHRESSLLIICSDESTMNFFYVLVDVDEGLTPLLELIFCFVYFFE